MKRIGLIVNRVAGMGGSVGLQDVAWVSIISHPRYVPMPASTVSSVRPSICRLIEPPSTGMSLTSGKNTVYTG